MQQIVALVLVLAIFAGSAPIVQWYHLPIASLWLVRAVSLSLLLASLRSIPGILLERRMQFGKVAVVDSAQALGYTVLAVTLALLGFKVWSLVLALLASSFIGLVLAYTFVRWHPALAFDWPVIKRLMRFGIPFQGITVVGLIKDSINPLLVGSIAGMASVGYINWANQIASYPVIAVWVINKVTFPLFARLQDDAQAFRESLELSMRINALASYGLVAPIVALAPSITTLVFGTKWLPGLPVLYLCAVAVLWVGPGLPVGNAMSAIGQSRTVFRFSILWAVLTWMIGVPLILRFGFVGYGIPCLAVPATTIFLFRKLSRLYPFYAWPNIAVPGLALTMAVGLGAVLDHVAPPTTVAALLLLIVVTMVTYGGVVWLCWKQKLLADASIIRKALMQ